MQKREDKDGLANFSKSFPKSVKATPTTTKSQNIRQESHLPKTMACSVRAKTTANIYQNQKAPQRKPENLSGTRAKYTSSVSIFPRNYSLQKSPEVKIRQIRKFNSLGTSNERSTEQKPLPNMKSYQLPPSSANRSSQRFKTYVSCVHTNLSNSWKFQGRNTQSFTFGEAKSEINPVVKTLNNLPGKEHADNSVDSDENQGISAKGMTVQEQQNKSIVFHDSRKNNFYSCSQCGSLIKQATAEQNICLRNGNEEEKPSKTKSISEMPATESVPVKKIQEDKVKIQKLPLMRSLTFSTPGKSVDNFSKKKPPSLATISIQKRKLWKSMSLSSAVPIIIVSSVDD